MNDESPPPDRAPAAPTIAELQKEAHSLINELAYRPGAAKLLDGVLRQLRTFTAYKSHRRGQMAARLKR
jgi:predicted metal-dependent HD superfamily phosphohydrolase